MACVKHGYTNSTYCPECDLEIIERNNPVTDQPKVSADALWKSLVAEELFSDAMDAAVASFIGVRYGITKNAENSGEQIDPEKVIRRSLYGAFQSYIREMESELTATQPAAAVPVACDYGKFDGFKDYCKHVAVLNRRGYNLCQPCADRQMAAELASDKAAEDYYAKQRTTPPTPYATTDAAQGDTQMRKSQEYNNLPPGDLPPLERLTILARDIRKWSDNGIRASGTSVCGWANALDRIVKDMAIPAEQQAASEPPLQGWQAERDDANAIRSVPAASEGRRVVTDALVKGACDVYDDAAPNRADAANWPAMYAAVAYVASTLPAGDEGMRRDAERYRRLREGYGMAWITTYRFKRVAGVEADSAVDAVLENDAAIAAQTAGNNKENNHGK